MRSYEYKLLSAGNMSGNITTNSQQVFQMYLFSVQAVWTGASAVGTLELLISNDNVTFSVYTGSATAVNGAGDFLWNLNSVGYQYIAVQYNFTSGTGSLNVTISGKGPA